MPESNTDDNDELYQGALEQYLTNGSLVSDFKAADSALTEGMVERQKGIDIIHGTVELLNKVSALLKLNTTLEILPEERGEIRVIAKNPKVALKDVSLINHHIENNDPHERIAAIIYTYPYRARTSIPKEHEFVLTGTPDTDDMSQDSKIRVRNALADEQQIFALTVANAFPPDEKKIIRAFFNYKKKVELEKELQVAKQKNQPSSLILQ